jgi:hypothetical protein
MTTPDSITSPTPAPDDTEHAPAADDSVMFKRRGAFFNLVVAPTVTIMAALGILAVAVHVVRTQGEHIDWVANAPTVETALNDTYVEDIQVVRERRTNVRPEVLIETVAIDGTVRTDCTVPNDTRPTIVCDNPVDLTVDPSTQGSIR